MIKLSKKKYNIDYLYWSLSYIRIKVSRKNYTLSTFGFIHTEKKSYYQYIFYDHIKNE
jgi:hypothetical protein